MRDPGTFFRAIHIIMQRAYQPLSELLPPPVPAAFEEALARGRRQVPVRDVAADLELTRDDVLAWLKANAHRGVAGLAATSASSIFAKQFAACHPVCR